MGRRRERLLKRPGRRYSPCTSLRYSVRVDMRRKELGRRVARARRAAGHRSQASFAAACGIGEKSVADVERGDSRPGEATYEAVERALNWPDGSIMAFLASGSPADFERLRPVAPDAESDERKQQLTQLLQFADRLEEQAQELRRQIQEMSQVSRPKH